MLREVRRIRQGSYQQQHPTVTTNAVSMILSLMVSTAWYALQLWNLLSCPQTGVSLLVSRSWKELATTTLKKRGLSNCCIFSSRLTTNSWVRKFLRMRRYVTKWLKSSMDLEKNHWDGLKMLNKILIEDLFWLTWYSGCYRMDNNQVYFNCIEYTFTILILMYFAIPWSIATTLFLAHHKAWHSITTKYGVSEPVYSNKETAIPALVKETVWGLYCGLISIIIIKICTSPVSHGRRRNFS